MPKNTTFFYKNLILWYLQNKRALPWRETKDPYKIWLSEILLQQTRVAQGLPYYLKFIEAFPTIFDLAKSSEEEVLKLWQGLGYYSRARNLHYTARYIVNNLDGVFPSSYNELLTLKGVGDYTASAIASICFAEPAAVVDGNVYRVLSRMFGVATPINSSQGIKEFKELAQTLLDKSSPGDYNQAIMEFGARYCVPQNPNCSSCIFSEKCVAFNTQQLSELPVKLKKAKVKKHYFNYLVVLSPDGETLLEQRIGKGIWENLYQFPLIESASELEQETMESHPKYMELAQELRLSNLTLYNSKTIIHKLSHKHLFTRFWIVKGEIADKRSIPIEEIHRFPVPILIGNFISEFSIFKQ